MDSRQLIKQSANRALLLHTSESTCSLVIEEWEVGTSAFLKGDCDMGLEMHIWIRSEVYFQPRSL